jgi:alginate O-acetyltransferase complex protein AlgJ
MIDAERLTAFRARLLTLMFVVAISLPLADWLFSFDDTPELTENRTAAAAPGWPHTLNAWRALPAAITAYWNDAFGFRKLMVRTHARLLLWLGDSPSPTTLVGSRGMLFFTGERSTDQFRGLYPLPATDLANWADALNQRKAWLAARGIRFLFVVTPSKESVYPELYPVRFNRVGPTTLDGLLSHLRAHTDVPILDLRSALQAAKGPEPLYFQTDTHWNDRGAYFAYQAMLTELQQWFPELPQRPLASFRAQSAPRYCGDLSAFVGLAQELKEPTSVLIPTPPPAAKTMFISPGKPRVEVYETAGRTRRALVFHDSFFMPPEQRDTTRHDDCFTKNSDFRLSQIFADSFARATFRWEFGSAFNAEMAASEHPDVVIQEIAERLLIFGPRGDVPR